MSEDWTAALRHDREQKDEYFGNDPHSPIPPDKRADFDGLAYYPIDEGYRFEVELDRYEDPDTRHRRHQYRRRAGLL